MFCCWLIFVVIIWLWCCGFVNIFRSCSCWVFFIFILLWSSRFVYMIRSFCCWLMFLIKIMLRCCGFVDVIGNVGCCVIFYVVFWRVCSGFLVIVWKFSWMVIIFFRLSYRVMFYVVF